MSDAGRAWPMRRSAAALVAILGLAWLTAPARADTATSPLATAAQAGDVKRLDALLAQGADPNSVDADGVSALAWASGLGRMDAVKALLAAHAAVDGSYNPQRFTPLMFAARFGRAEAVTALIAAGADVNAHAADGRSPLDFAADGADGAVLALLADHGARRGRGFGADQPKALCSVADGDGFYGDNYPWKEDPAHPGRFFCFASAHENTSAPGASVAYGYEVEGTAQGAARVQITVDIYDDVLPSETIAAALRPLLTTLWAVGGHGPAPDGLIDTLSAARDAQQDTALGQVTATYQPGSDANKPFLAAHYRIEIRLH